MLKISHWISKNSRIISNLIVFVLLSSSLLESCAIDIQQVPPVRKDNSPTYSSERVLYLGRLDVYLADRDLFVGAWKTSLKSIIKSHRIFRKIENLPAKKELLAESYYILDIDITPHLEEKYNWWASWPAVYPAVAYWPLQIRDANYSVDVEYILFDSDQKEILRKKVTKSDKYGVIFYGFFRTSAFEDLIEKVNLEVMEECARSLKTLQ